MRSKGFWGSTQQRWKRIEDSLALLERDGVIRDDWYANRPQGKRWNITTSNGISRAYTTTEIEVFIEGALAGWESLAARS